MACRSANPPELMSARLTELEVRSAACGAAWQELAGTFQAEEGERPRASLPYVPERWYAATR